MAIPKIIHYCWFGGSEKSELIKRCISSWRTFCPDYKIIEWNESNTDLNACQFIRDAYKDHAWAFVSDYIRLKALFEYGGIYLDTDVEVIKSLDSIVVYHAVAGYADNTYIGTSLIASEAGNEWIKCLLKYYDKTDPILNYDKQLYKKANNEIITEISMKEYQFRVGDNSIDSVGLHIFPTESFSPFKKKIIGNRQKLNSHKNFDIKENTLCIHYADGSWVDSKDNTSIKMLVRQILRTLLPRPIYYSIKRKMEFKRLGYK